MSRQAVLVERGAAVLTKPWCLACSGACSLSSRVVVARVPQRAAALLGRCEPPPVKTTGIPGRDPLALSGRPYLLPPLAAPPSRASVWGTRAAGCSQCARWRSSAPRALRRTTTATSTCARLVATASSAPSPGEQWWCALVAPPTMAPPLGCSLRRGTTLSRSFGSPRTRQRGLA